MTKTTQTVLITLFVVALVFAFLLALDNGVRGIEKRECQEWQRDSIMYSNWYALDWQVNQCLSFGIELE